MPSWTAPFRWQLLTKNTTTAPTVSSSPENDDDDNRTMIYHTNKQSDIAAPKVPRGLRSLPLPQQRLQQQETARGFGQQLQSEAAAVERWWSQPRWQHTKRVYSGASELGATCLV